MAEVKILTPTSAIKIMVMNRACLTRLHPLNTGLIRVCRHRYDVLLSYLLSLNDSSLPLTLSTSYGMFISPGQLHLEGASDLRPKGTLRRI